MLQQQHSKRPRFKFRRRTLQRNGKKGEKKESETADIFTFQSLQAAWSGFSETSRNLSTTVSTLKKEEEIARGDISFNMVSQLQKI